MAQINVNSRVLSNVNNENIIAMLNSIIDAELSKDVAEIDAAFVNECVDALLQLENEENGLVALVPLMSSDKFLKSITKDKTYAFKNLNVFVRVALIAAIVAGGTLTANAAVQAVTGVNVLQEFGTKVSDTFQSWGWINHEGIEQIEGIDDDDEEETTTSPVTTTTKPAEESTTTPQTTRPQTTQPTTQPTTKFEGIEQIEGVDDDDDETTTQPTTQPTTKFEGIEQIEGVDDDDDETTTKPTTTKPAVTSPKPVAPTKPSDNSKKLESISADINNFKTDYIYGESFDPSGLRLYANYDDGTAEQISLDDCYYSYLNLKAVTKDYKFAIMYKSCKLEFDITVRPDEDTRGSRICESSEYDYLLTANGAYITAYKGDETELVMNTVDGNKIIAVGARVFNGKQVTGVSSDSVTKLFESAFKDCEKLKTASFPNTVYIGDNAFNGCKKLTSVSYSDKLDYLGASSFEKTAIENMTIPSSVIEIPNGLFDTNTSLKSVTFSGNVVAIGKNAFSSCTSLEEVTGCGSIKEVGDYAFYDCGNVNFDTFPQALERVGECGFFMCQKLDIGALPQTIKAIGKSSFAYCTLLTSLEIPEGIKIIPYEAFRGTGAKTVIIPEGVEVIEDYALRATKASTITLPSTLRVLGSESLYSPLLRKVYFGRNIEKIADDAFYIGRSVTFYVYEDTLPMQWAIENGIKYVIQ